MGDLEVDENVGVDDCGKKKDSRKRTSHKCCESGYCVDLNTKQKYYGTSPYDVASCSWGN